MDKEIKIPDGIVDYVKRRSAMGAEEFDQKLELKKQAMVEFLNTLNSPVRIPLQDVLKNQPIKERIILIANAFYQSSFPGAIQELQDFWSRAKNRTINNLMNPRMVRSVTRGQNATVSDSASPQNPRLEIALIAWINSAIELAGDEPSELPTKEQARDAGRARDLSEQSTEAIIDLFPRESWSLI